MSTFFNLIWSCPKIQGYWAQVIKFTNDHMGVPVTKDYKQCLLFTDAKVYVKRSVRVFIDETLFLALKIIVKHWLTPKTPSLFDWTHSLSSSLPHH